MLDPQGRPYFLWDCDLTLPQFTDALRSDDVETRAYFVGKLLRQAKPDDVFQFVSLAELGRLWPTYVKYLGSKEPFWRWLLSSWGVLSDGKTL